MSMKVLNKVAQFVCTGMTFWSILKGEMTEANFWILMQISLRLSEDKL
jgi:hypothetical protein